MDRIESLLVRGSNINNVSQKNNWNALHWAIENNIPSRFVKFLLKSGCNPHLMDINGKDCCDKAKNMARYMKITALHN
jgi:ankyrin repeat protein